MKRIGDHYPEDPPRVGRMWVTFAHLGIVAGLVCAFFAWGLGVSLTALFALSAASWTVIMVGRDEDQPTWSVSLVRTGVVSGVSALAILGAFSVLHWLGAGLLLTLLLTAPWFRRWLRRSSARFSMRFLPTSQVNGENGSVSRTGTAVPPLPTALEPGADEVLELDHFDPSFLDDDVLCLAWHNSFVHLQAAGSVSDRLRLVQRRQKLLDELSRRHEPEIRRWLDSGARAASNPGRFLNQGPPPPRPRE
jgi:hypothetical protein